MRYFVVSLLVVGLIFSLIGCSTVRSTETASTPPSITLEELLARLPAKDSVEARWAFSTILAMDGGQIHAICNGLRAPQSTADIQARYALHGIALHVQRSGEESHRVAFVSALARELEANQPTEAATFLIEQLQVAGRSESVSILSQFLGNDKLCEPAVQALLAIRQGAEAPIVSALPGAVGACRLTLLKALGDLRSRPAVGILMKSVSAEDPSARKMSLYALANLGDPEARAILKSATEEETGGKGLESLSNYLLFAQRLAENGNMSLAEEIAREVAASHPADGYVRSAALTLLVKARGPAALDDLLWAMQDRDKALRNAALGLAPGIPGTSSTSKWVTAMNQAPPNVRSEILAMLGRRGDETALPAIVGSLDDTSSGVRSAAIEAASHFDGGLPSLLAFLEHTSRPEDISMARGAIDRFPAKNVIPQVIEHLPRVTPPARASLVEQLAKYGTLVPSGPIVALCNDNQPSVRLAALKTLSSIGSEKDQPQLISVLLSARGEGEQSAAQRSLAAVCDRIADPGKRADGVLDRLRTASADEAPLLMRALGRIGGKSAMKSVLERAKNENTKEQAIRALADWPTIDAFDSLLAIAAGKEKLNLRVLCLRGCVRIVEQAPINAATAARYHARTLAAAERVEEKRLVLGVLGNLRDKEALRIVSTYLGDDSLGLDAAMAASKICSSREEKAGELGSTAVARVFIESAVSPSMRSSVMGALDASAEINDPPEGFVPLFNGRDLAGWKGLVGNPVERASMRADQLEAAQMREDSSMHAHWSVVKGVIVFDGKGESLCTSKDYGDFEMLVDWKIEKNGDSGIYLRGSPQVQIWDPAQWPEGSGGLYNNQKGPNKPLLRADNAPGQWNTFRIRMIGERVTVYLNDVLVVDSVALENYWDRSKPIFPVGQIELQSHNSPLFFRNIFIREIPRRKQTFEGALFNGSTLGGWQVIDGREGSWQVENGVLFTKGGGGGWLSTIQEFGDFQLDLDFRVPTGGNSGVFIRAPHGGDPAYTGMEIQVLDDYATEYATLRPWQYTGSIYGVQAPSSRVSRRADEWQHMQIIAGGPLIKVTLNGQRIIDTNLITHMDKEAGHPGLKRRQGFIGLQNHSTRIEYRNITLKELR